MRLIEKLGGKIQKKYDIFGSCVTRDLFEFDEVGGFKCGEYIARQSIVSAISPPLSLSDGDFDSVKSEFQKRLLINDFQKTTFAKLKASDAKYLIIDLIDERFNLVEINNTYVTKSSELMVSGYLNNNKHNIIDKRNWDKNKIYCKLDIFLEKIKSIYSTKKIVIHKAKFVNNYLGKDEEKHSFSNLIVAENSKTNDMLDIMYDYIEANLKNALIIDISNNYYAYENHKWGLMPIHYQPQYYLKVIKILKENY